MILSELIKLCITSTRVKRADETYSTELELIHDKEIIFFGTIDDLIDRNMDLFQEYCGSQVLGWMIQRKETEYHEFKSGLEVYGCIIPGVLSIRVGKPVDFIDKWIDFLYDDGKSKKSWKPRITLWDFIRLNDKPKNTRVVIRTKEGIYNYSGTVKELRTMLDSPNHNSISNYDYIYLMYVEYKELYRTGFRRLFGKRYEYPHLTIHLDI